MSDTLNACAKRQSIHSSNPLENLNLYGEHGQPGESYAIIGDLANEPANEVRWIDTDVMVTDPVSRRFHQQVLEQVESVIMKRANQL